jgi:hypothetical protein
MYNESAREPDLIDYTEAVARMEWQEAVNAYEDGLSDVEPPEWKEFWG